MPVRLDPASLMDSFTRPSWDLLWNRQSIGRIAICVVPDAATVEHLRREYRFEVRESLPPVAWRSTWTESLEQGLVDFLAALAMPGDGYPCLAVPRFVHLQSQGIVEVFGARAVPQPDGNVFAVPLDLDPLAVDRVVLRRPQDCVTWNAVEWISWARRATGEALPIRMPVMTGPFDTAGYLLGFTTLMEWCRMEEQALGHLLDTIADANILFIQALQQAAGGHIDSHQFWCMRGGFDLCSETRSLVSAETCLKFEIPRLRRIGAACGSYGIHSCGSWERTISSSLADPNLRAMNGQVRENDLSLLCREAAGHITLSIGPSVNVHQEYLWPDRESYFRFLLETVPPDQPFETWVAQSEVPLWLRLHREIHGTDFELLPPLWEGR